MINTTKYRNLYLLPLCCLLIFFIVKSVHRPADDYAGYYFGSKFFSEGTFDASTIYETSAFNHKIYAAGYSNLLVSYTPFPPITSLFFLPFTGVGLFTSKLIFNCLSTLLFLFSLRRIVRFLGQPDWIFLLIPLVFYIPLRNNIFFGQVYLILFSLLVEGFIFYKKGNYFYAALVWAPAIVLKIFPLIGLLFLFFKKDWKQISYLMAVVIVLLLFSFSINGIEVWKIYILEIFPRVSNGELNSAFAADYQSMFMLLKKAFVYDALQNPFAVLDSALLLNTFNFLFKALVLSGCTFVSLSKKAGDFEKFGAWLLGSILISPNGSTYSLIMLLIPFLGILRFEKSRLYKTIVLVLVLLINNLPVNAFSSLPVPLQFPRLYLVIGLFIFLIYQYKITVNYKVLLGISVLISITSVPAWHKNETDNSVYFLPRNDYSLIYDYTIKDHQLIVFYYNDIKGPKTDTINFEQQVKPGENLSLKNRQVYLGEKQLTNSADRKMKPTLLNSGELLYLSDKNRGIGFYTLRLKKL